ncbi:ABC transporter permease [Indiicoccus explosivorum]|uniref:ABC transporter permease n=1 Tax=Indiicoccus explosivorum TaxID=1917864 RepID=UPI000B44CEE0|nr:ABC transporter permease [Indiicoccus explosivorum]
MQAFIVAERVIAQVVKDKRTIGLMLVAPLFVLFLMYVILGSASDEAAVGLVEPPENFGEVLARSAETVEFGSSAEAEEALKDLEVHAIVDFTGDSPEILIEGGDVSKSGQALRVIRGAFTEFAVLRSTAVNEELMAAVSRLQERAAQLTWEEAEMELPEPAVIGEPEISFLYGGEDAEQFDQLAPALMGFFIFFFVFIIAGVSFLRERSTGTLERTLATPLKRSSIVFGYFIGFFLFVTIQTVLIQLFIVNVLDVPQSGNYFLLLVVNLVTASVALALGLLLSSFARTEFQLFQFIPIVIVPQVFFSGIFDLSDAPVWVEFISGIMPLTYAAHALQNIMIRGAAFTDIWLDAAVLAGFVGAFVLLNMQVLKKQRPV